jgi:hypothetical protein
MVAAHGHRTFLDKVHDGLDRPLWISAVTNIVAQEDVLHRTMIAGMRQTCAECLSIGVNVREYRNEHG